MNETLSLFFGFTILYLFSWFLIAIFIYLYSIISHKAKSLRGSVFSVSALLALIYVLTVSIALIFFSFNKYFYIAITFIALTYSFFLIMRKHKRQQFIDAVIMAVGLALILNPGWLGFLGIK